MIRSLYGIWKGDIRELSAKTVLGKPIMVNETRWVVVYSLPQKDRTVGYTDEISVYPGEAICFVKPGRRGRVVVGPEDEIADWIRWYFFEPQMIFNTDNLTIENCFLKVCGVSVIRGVLQSYPASVAHDLSEILRPRYPTGTEERAVLELMLLSMKGVINE